MKDLLVHSAKAIITGPPTPYSVLQPKCEIKLEDSRFLGYDALKLGESFPMFRKILKVSSSREKQPKFIVQLSETRLLWSLYLREETFF